MSLLIYLGIILICGLIFGKISSTLKLPKVTGYLIAGILIGPSVLKVIPKDIIGEMGIISEVALGIISYGIGKELNFKNLRKMGSGVIIITIFEAFTTVLLVDLIFIFILNKDVAFSMILGAIAAATAPASTIMVIKQYKARGPLVNTLLPVVAIDDVMAVLALGISLSLSKNISCMKLEDLHSIAFVGPMIEMIQAILIGCLLGFIMNIFCNKIKSKESILSIAIAMVFMSIGIAKGLNISTILTTMVLGATVSNMCPDRNILFDVVDSITPPIFLIFFTLSGAELELFALKSIGVMGAIYIVVRALGKIIGARIGAKIAGAEKNVQKYLGITLMPQAGVAIGLVVVASTALPEYGQTIRAIVLSATVIYELIGPYLTKIAIFKAREI